MGLLILSIGQQQKTFVTAGTENHNGTSNTQYRATAEDFCNSGH